MHEIGTEQHQQHEEKDNFDFASEMAEDRWSALR